MRRFVRIRLMLLAVIAIAAGNELWAQKELPYSYGFETTLAAEGWTLSNASTNTGIKQNTNYVTYSYTGDYGFVFNQNTDYNPQYLISPQLESNSGVVLEFYYKGTSQYSTLKFTIGYSTTDNEISSFTWESENSFASNVYNCKQQNLSTANIKYIAIKFDRNGTYASMYVDDFRISELPTCPAPTLSSTVKTTSTTATITWEPSSGSQELFDIYYSTSSTAPTEETTPSVSNTSGSSYKITGLEPETTYYVWLRGNCGTAEEPDISGGWTQSESFTTEHSISIPYTCGFEGLSTPGHPLPSYWSRPDGISSDYPDAYKYQTYAHTDEYSLRFCGDASSTAQIGVLPELDETLNGKHITFYARVGYYYDSDNLIVGYMTDRYDASTFTAVSTLSINSISHSKYKIDFGEYEGDPRYIAIKSGITNSSYSLYIDDIVVYSGTEPESNLDTDNGNAGDIAIPRDISISANITAGEITIVEGELTIAEGGTLTCNDINVVGGSLTIAEGGQLICANSVPATVKKSITASTASKDGEGWYTIASPVHTDSYNYVAIGSETTVNLTADDYDMFYYDETASKWRNQKANGGAAGFTQMNAGQGYLYRNSGNELSFVGNTNQGDVSVSLTYTSGQGSLAGFNLIGNPYPHSIAKGSGQAIDHANLASGFYTITNAGAWTSCTDGDEIKANQGLLVQATEATSLTISDVNYVAASKANNDKIQFSVKNAQYSDVAYALFDKGVGLNKIDHRNPEIPMLYISQDDGNFAIAMMSDDTKTFNLNFKAMTMGQYTIRAKAEGDFSYMHLIDRLTGTDTDMLLDGEYTFLASPTDSDGRFIVRLDYSAGGETTGDDIFAYQSGDDIIVSGEGELQMFDITGRMVMKATVNGVQTFGKPETAGVYVLRLVGNEMRTQKVVVSR